MFTTVTLLAPRQSRIVLPASALLMNNDRTTVFVEVAPWTFERRTVDAELQEGPMATLARACDRASASWFRAESC